MLVVNADNFMAADTNGDGALDRKEFAMYLHKIDTSISSLLTVPDDLTAEVDKDASIGFDLESLTRGTDFVHGCWNSLLVILVTELGDKTFIAAIMAMRYGEDNRLCRSHGRAWIDARSILRDGPRIAKYLAERVYTFC